MNLLPKLNSDEEKAIAEFRNRMKSRLSSDMYEDDLLFYRFLKARDFQVDDAESMLQKHLIWRKIYQVDSMVEEFKPIKFFTKYAQPAIFGFDKEGSLVAYNPTGKLETKDLYKCVKKHDYMKHFIWCAELYKTHIGEEIAKGRKCNKKMCVILDFDQLTFANGTRKDSMDLILSLINNYQNNYPEHLKAVYAINAPNFYVIGYAIFKTIMSNAMLEKIHVYGTSGWKEKLLEVMDPDILPAFLGGNRTDPDGDPMCYSIVRHGGTFDPEYFLTHEERFFNSKSETKVITVPKGQKVEIAVGEINVGYVIHWAFYSKSNISFGLFREVNDKKLEEVMPMWKYETSDGSERDSYKVKTKGRYIIIFDNTCSWLYSKDVEYCIEVTKLES